MKKFVLILMLATTSTLVYSCRESTQQKSREAVESIGEDIEHNTREAGRKIEDGARKVQQEVQEEIDRTDDVNNRE